MIGNDCVHHHSASIRAVGVFSTMKWRWVPYENPVLSARPSGTERVGHEALTLGHVWLLGSPAALWRHESGRQRLWSAARERQVLGKAPYRPAFALDPGSHSGRHDPLASAPRRPGSRICSRGRMNMALCPACAERAFRRINWEAGDAVDG